MEMRVGGSVRQRAPLFPQTLKTSQELLFSQAFNHPSSVTATVPCLIRTQDRYRGRGEKQKNEEKNFLSLFKTIVRFVLKAEYL